MNNKDEIESGLCETFQHIIGLDNNGIMGSPPSLTSNTGEFDRNSIINPKNIVPTNSIQPFYSKNCKLFKYLTDPNCFNPC